MKRTSINFILVTLLIFPMLNSCNLYIVEGNNEVSDEVRSVPNFDRINLEGSFDVYVEESDTTEVLITCESNLMPYIETTIYGRELTISTPGAIVFHENFPIEIHIKTPNVERLKVSGSGRIVTDSIYANELGISVSGSGNISTYFVGNKLSITISGSGSTNVFAVNNETDASISGSGQIKLEGLGNNTSCTISGSGNYKGYDYTTKTATAKISGSGQSYLYVSNSLTCQISGSGNIYFKGPASVQSSVSGSGRVINANN